jgi:hypothetical protein
LFKAVSLFLAIALFAWLMPLGAFIKKTEEKTACGGKRAFHMCSMMQESQPTQEGPSDGVVKFTSASGSVEKSQPSGSGGNEFFSDVLSAALLERAGRFYEMRTLAPQLVIVRPFEHVPLA